MRLAAVLCALTLSGCASALVGAEGAIHRAIAVTQDTADAICDAHLKDADSCRAFNVKLVPVISSAKAFNLAVRENSAAEIPAMLASLLAMRDAAAAFFDPSTLAAIQTRIESAWSLVSSMRR